MKGLFSVLWVLLVIVLNKCESIESADYAVSQSQALDQSTLPEGYTIFPNHNVAYKIYHEALQWDAARNRCKSDGGDLAIADTRNKIQYIRNMDLLKDDWIFVGIYKPAGSARWKTVKEAELLTASIPWASWGEDPNKKWPSKDCATIMFEENSLRPFPCGPSSPFVCGIPTREHQGVAEADYAVSQSQALDQSTLPEGYTIFPNHNVAYKIYHEPLKWDAARNRCKSDGGDLAIADTVDKIQYIQNMDLLKDDWIFVGIYKPAGSARWKTVKEVELSTASIPWASWASDPNRIGSFKDCAVIVLSENRLELSFCDISKPFVCGIPTREHQGVAEVTTTTTPATTTLISTRLLPLPPLPTKATTSNNFPLQSIEIPRLGILYKFHGDRLTHHEARERCFSDGGRLAVVDSFEKINVISKILDEEPVHVGIRVSSANFEEWVGDSDGKPLKDLPWTANNPHPAKCAALRKDGGGLEETLCSSKLKFLCEIVNNNN